MRAGSLETNRCIVIKYKNGVYICTILLTFRKYPECDAYKAGKK